MRHQQCVVVGAGIVGLSTAYALLKQGAKNVSMVEQEAVDHRRGTSHGISRLLRFEYGSDIFYSEMVRLSLSRWKLLEQRTRRTLYTPSGILVLGTENDNFTQSSHQTIRKMGMPIEKLSNSQCQQRFPQFANWQHDLITYNPEAGILHASACLQTLKALILELGGTIYESCRVTQIAHEQQRPVRIHTSTGNEFSSDRVVVAAGPWVHRLLGDVALPVRMTRQYLLYFAGLPLSAFKLDAFPAFMTNDVYGFPIHNTCDNSYGPNWLKAASHTFGKSVDPDDILPADEQVVASAAYKLRELIPALAQAELVHVDACMYDVSPDENFILDHLPRDPRIIFATGLTGHGFKFGLLLGEILSSMVCSTPPPLPLERFKLARFERLQHTISVA